PDDPNRPLHPDGRRRLGLAHADRPRRRRGRAAPRLPHGRPQPRPGRGPRPGQDDDRPEHRPPGRPRRPSRPLHHGRPAPARSRRPRVRAGPRPAPQLLRPARLVGPGRAGLSLLRCPRRGSALPGRQPKLRTEQSGALSYAEYHSSPPTVGLSAVTPHRDMEDASWARASGETVSSAAGRWPVLAHCPEALAWLRIQADLGLAPRTLEAYSRGLADYLGVCAREGIEPLSAGRAEV